MRGTASLLAAVAFEAIAAAGAIDKPLAAAGDAARGKRVVASREANCLLCHEVPDSGVAAMGNVGPALAGVGARLSAAELRARIVDSTRLNPESVMPSYHRTQGLARVAKELRGKPVLDAQEVEDVVAYLGTLK